jgi:hypothetical protein
VLASPNHPNIAHVHGLEQRDGATAVVMELVEGPTLDHRIRQGAIPLDEALTIARQIADALDAAHERGIVHRDLKPANVKLRDDGTVKVLDFGLAKAMGPASGPDPSLSDSPTFTSPAMTAHGVILGTAGYMAPEQAGGPAQTLCDAAEGRGGTWNDDGVILFAPTPFGQIHRVADDGGQPVPITGAADETGPVRRFPWFLPDGRHFLYTDAAAGGERNGIYVGSIDGGLARRLLPDDSNAVYAPAASGPGSILFVRDGVLMAQPFDADRLEPAGDVFVVAEGLSSSGNRGFYAFSAVGGGSLAYRRDAGDGGSNLAQLAWRDRVGKVLEPLGRPARFVEIALSPDETRAALGVTETDTASDIWIFHLRRGEMSGSCRWARTALSRPRICRRRSTRLEDASRRTDAGWPTSRMNRVDPKSTCVRFHRPRASGSSRPRAGSCRSGAATAASCITSSRALNAR